MDIKKNRAKRRVGAISKKRVLLKEMAIRYKGGCCHICGYNKCRESMEFHHIDPKLKSFGISRKGYSKSWEVVREELDKCVMLCANCHRELSAGLIRITRIAR